MERISEEELKEAYSEFLQMLKENPLIAKALKEGLLELYIRTKPRFKICLRRRFKRKLSWQHFYMAGVYSAVKGLKGKVEDLPIGTYVAKESFKRLSPYEREKLRLLFGIKPPKYSYVSVNPKLLKKLELLLKKRELVRKYKVKQVLR